MIEVNKNNFYEVIEKYFTKLSGKIEQVRKVDFESVFGCELATRKKNIVYI